MSEETGETTLSPEQLLGEFRAYFTGVTSTNPELSMVAEDAAQLIHGRTGLPYTGEMVFQSGNVRIDNQYRTRLSDTSIRKEHMREAVHWGLKAYGYSGAEINVDLVHAIAEEAPDFGMAAARLVMNPSLGDLRREREAKDLSERDLLALHLTALKAYKAIGGRFLPDLRVGLTTRRLRYEVEGRVPVLARSHHP